MTSVKADPALLRGFVPGDYDDVGLETDAEFVGNATATVGLTLRYSEADNKRSYYLFAITTNGDYYLTRMVNGISQDLVEPTRSPLIKPAPNRNTLGIIAVGSNLSLYINRTFVRTVSDTMLRAKGKAALAFYGDAPPAAAAFSRFAVYTPDQAKTAWSTSAAPNAPPTSGGPTPNARAVDGEKTDLMVHPGYKRFTTNYADFSVNIPESWQSLAEEAKGRQIVLGSMGSKTNLEIDISAAGENLDQVINNWVQSMKGQVVIPASQDRRRTL